MFFESCFFCSFAVIYWELGSSSADLSECQDAFPATTMIWSSQNKPQTKKKATKFEAFLAHLLSTRSGALNLPFVHPCLSFFCFQTGAKSGQAKSSQAAHITLQIFTFPSPALIWDIQRTRLIPLSGECWWMLASTIWQLKVPFKGLIHMPCIETLLYREWSNPACVPLKAQRHRSLSTFEIWQCSKSSKVFRLTFFVLLAKVPDQTEWPKHGLHFLWYVRPSCAPVCVVMFLIVLDILFGGMWLADKKVMVGGSALVKVIQHSAILAVAFTLWICLPSPRRSFDIFVGIVCLAVATAGMAILAWFCLA